MDNQDDTPDTPTETSIRDEELQLLEVLENKVLSAMIENSKHNFYIFVQLMAPVALPDKFVDGVHIKLICDALQKVEESVTGKEKKPERLQLWLPPGSMKSKLASQLFPAWCLGRHPNWCFLGIAADADLAIDNIGRPVKEIVDSERYRAIFPNTILKKDVSSAARWDTTRKGRFVARGAGQSITGRRAHISLCDDVVTEHSGPIDLKNINDWYLPGLRSRLLPTGAEIVINTRWYINDLSGYTVNLDKKTDRPWTVIKIPAILDKEASELLRRGLDASDDRFMEGTSFWPEFWPTSVLLEKREVYSSATWNALYMQTPISEETGIVKRSHFKLWPEENPPPCKYVVISMDTAFSQKETADFSAYTVWGVFNQVKDMFDGSKVDRNSLILLEAGRGRWDFAELCNRAQDLDRQYRPDFVIIEDKASGQSLIPEMRKRGLPIMEYKPERDKMFRLQACTPYFQAGRIFVPTGKVWAEDLVDETVTFPKAPHDDMVDTMSQAILWMRDRFMIDNDGYRNEPDEVYNSYNRHKVASYWSSSRA